MVSRRKKVKRLKSFTLLDETIFFSDNNKSLPSVLSEKRNLIYLIVVPNLAPKNKKPYKLIIYRVLS